MHSKQTKRAKESNNTTINVTEFSIFYLFFFCSQLVWLAIVERLEINILYTLIKLRKKSPIITSNATGSCFFFLFLNLFNLF